VDPEAPPAPLLQKQLTRRARGSAVGRSVYKWRRERRAAAALREGGKEEKRRRPLLPTGTALGIAPSPPRRRRPQQVMVISPHPPLSCLVSGLGFAAAAAAAAAACVGWGPGVLSPPHQGVSVELRTGSNRLLRLDPPLARFWAAHLQSDDLVGLLV
jgi:hypothetical protein